MARVLLQNITKVFHDQVVAVSDIDLDVADGEFMVIVGPSGCGKTTTLRMIAGLEKASAGNIYIGDTLVNDVHPRDRDVAMVLQNFALYPHMTAHQNMAFALRMQKLPKAETKNRVEKTAKLLGIENLLHRKPRALSGGQRQRVALGRAIVRNPKVFLLDEPLSNLDAGLRLAMRTELKNLHGRLRITTVYVTHDQVEAMSLGDRIAVMLDGTIQQTGDPVQVYDYPVNRFVAGFLGTPPMNFFAGRVEYRDNTPSFVIDGQTVVLPQTLGDVLQEHRGTEMVLGIRPEDILLKGIPGQPNNAIAATVNVIEPLGPCADVSLANDAGQEFTISVDAHTRLRAKDAVEVHIDVEKAHIFEAGSVGRNVSLPGRAK
jgi:multiple sugar transport system ATP-binding protein